jgi:glycerophosphoryl diester phosphodiesterase
MPARHRGGGKTHFWAMRILALQAWASALFALLPGITLAFDVQGHRGARGLAPENTIAAFERALAIGVDTLETDVAVTSDGVPVIAHDPYLNPSLVRGPDGVWLAGPGPAIRTLTLAQLAAYDVGRLDPASTYAKQFPVQQPVDGQRIPTLAAVLALGTGNKVRFNIETKLTPDQAHQTLEPEPFAILVVQAIRTAGLAQRATIQSFDWRTLREVNRIAPEIATVCLTIESANFDTVQRASGKASPWHAGLTLGDHNGSLPRLAKAAGCSTWSMFWRNLTPEAVTEAHAIGLLVIPWTVNDPVEMGRLIDWQVDGIITDYPDRLRNVLSARGKRVP